MGIFKASKKTIPVIKLEGVITANARGGRNSGISFAGMRSHIDKAFAVKSAPFVALLINSPGGSPVQSALIGEYIRQKAEQNDMKVYAFCEDVAASGGYWLAASADKIYAMPASIIGSIGVIAAMFGFTDLIKKIGVERRIYSAGAEKSQLDPFMPEDKKQIEHLKNLQKEIHQNFIDWVTTRRGQALETQQDIFTGQFWDGHSAKKLGLIDAIGSLDGVLFEEFGKKYQLKVFGTQKKNLLKFITEQKSLTHQVDTMLSELQQRTHWERFGL